MFLFYKVTSLKPPERNQLWSRISKQRDFLIWTTHESCNRKDLPETNNLRKTTTVKTTSVYGSLIQSRKTASVYERQHHGPKKQPKNNPRNNCRNSCCCVDAAAKDCPTPLLTSITRCSAAEPAPNCRAEQPLMKKEYLAEKKRGVLLSDGKT